MSNPKKKKRRKLPKNIVEKPDREVMTRIFGKRIIKKVDQVLDEHSKSPENAPWNKVTMTLSLCKVHKRRTSS